MTHWFPGMKMKHVQCVQLLNTKCSASNVGWSQVGRFRYSSLCIEAMESSDWTQDGVGVGHRHAGRHWNWALDRGGGCSTRTWDCKAHNPSTRPGHLIAAHTLHNRREHIPLCKCAAAHKHDIIMVVQDAAIRRFYSELHVIVIYTRNYWFKIGATHIWFK